MSLADVAVMSATVVAVVALVPQLVRLRRTRDASGVSLAWATIGAVTNVTWVAYMVSADLWAALPSAAAMSVLYALLAVVIVRAGVPLRRPLLAAGAWGLVLVIVTAAAGWPVLGIVLGVAYAVQVAPSVWAAYRTWAPRGIAPATWACTLLEAALWGVYGVAERDAALVLFAITGITASIAILARWAATRHRFEVPPAVAVPG